jgi:hypothetical protein
MDIPRLICQASSRLSGWRRNFMRGTTTSPIAFDMNPKILIDLASPSRFE